jgi:hypothetical protein
VATRLYGLKMDNKMLMAVAYTSPQLHHLVYDRLDEIEAEAKRIFSLRRKLDGHNDSETSPPSYVMSFRKRRMAKSWRLLNIDPGAMWVEFGAHAGGKEFVLGYRPMGIALDVVAARHGLENE